MRASLNDSLRLRPGRLGRFVLFAALALPVACIGGDSLTELPSDMKEARIPWDLDLNYHAINIAVGDEVQLAIAPKDAAGTPIPLSALPPVEYTVTDTTAVQIDASGKLTALRSGTVVLVARMGDPKLGWTVDDSSRVTVVETPYALTGLRLMLQGPPVQPANRSIRFDAVAVDAAGQPLRDADGDTIKPTTYYAVSVPRSHYYTSTPWTGLGYARNLAQPTIRGASYIFGDIYEDSVTITVTYPDSARLYISRLSNQLDPSPSVMGQTDVTILKGGKVSFYQNNTTSRGDDIVFDDLSAVINGNIPVVGRDAASTVTFPNVGTFTYTSSTIRDMYGNVLHGTITVVEPPAP